MQYAFSQPCYAASACHAFSVPSDSHVRPDRLILCHLFNGLTAKRWASRCKSSVAARKRHHYSSSDEDRYQDTPEDVWQNDYVCAEPASEPAGPTSQARPVNTGALLLGAAALIVAAVSYFKKSSKHRSDDTTHATQTASPGQRRPPKSEAELDSTVRTLTEQRLEHVSTDTAQPGVSLRQPAQATWRQHGVGQVSCPTRVNSQQRRQQPQYREHVVSNSAALELMQLQLQYLVFLKQSDSIRGLKQKAEPVVVQ